MANPGQVRSWRRQEETPQRQSEYQYTAGAIDGFLNIVERNGSEKYLKELSYPDPLTSLPNLSLFHDHFRLVLSQASRYGYMAAMVMLDIDIDPCKTINDVREHLGEDFLLKSIGQKLTGQFRNADTVARLSGKEFGIIATRISRVADTAKIAQRILNLFQQPFLFEDNEFWISASIGVALYPRDARDPQTLMKNANMARYSAKVAGRNNFQHYSPRLNLWRQENLSKQAG